MMKFYSFYTYNEQRIMDNMTIDDLKRQCQIDIQAEGSIQLTR